jgi:hypothetical protein
MTFRYTDVDGDRLAVFTAQIPSQGPGVNFKTDPRGCSIPLDRLEELIAGVRDTGREAAEYAEQPSPPAAMEPSDQPRLFHLQRDRDVSGVSGTGRVANGVLWPDGTVSLRWIGERPSTVSWDRLADAEAVHGHGGATRIVWADELPPAPEPEHRLDDGSTHTHTAITNAGEACLMHACRAAQEETRLRQEQYRQAAALDHLADEIRDMAADGQIPATAAARLRELIAAAAQKGGRQ